MKMDRISPPIWREHNIRQLRTDDSDKIARADQPNVAPPPTPSHSIRPEAPAKNCASCFWTAYTVRTVIHTMLYMMRDHADTQTKRPLIGIIRQLIQKVAIASTPGRQPPALELHGRIASILAAIETAQIMEAKFTAMVDQWPAAGFLDTELRCFQ